MATALSDGQMVESTQAGGKKDYNMVKEPILILKVWCVKVFGRMVVGNIG